MLRCLQGLLFLGIAIFAVKWQFHIDPFHPGSLLKGIPPRFDSPPPWDVPHKLIEAGIIALVGVYVLVTGEIRRLKKKLPQYVPETFLACAATFLADFITKFGYEYGEASAYYPPFEKTPLAFSLIFFGGIAAYYFLIGEFKFWRRRTGE